MAEEKKALKSRLRCLYDDLKTLGSFGGFAAKVRSFYDETEFPIPHYTDLDELKRILMMALSEIHRERMAWVFNGRKNDDSAMLIAFASIFGRIVLQKEKERSECEKQRLEAENRKLKEQGEEAAQERDKILKAKEELVKKNEGLMEENHRIGRERDSALEMLKQKEEELGTLQTTVRLMEEAANTQRNQALAAKVELEQRVANLQQLADRAEGSGQVWKALLDQTSKERDSALTAKAEAEVKDSELRKEKERVEAENRKLKEQGEEAAQERDKILKAKEELVKKLTEEMREEATKKETKKDSASQGNCCVCDQPTTDVCSECGVEWCVPCQQAAPDGTCVMCGVKS